MDLFKSAHVAALLRSSSVRTRNFFAFGKCSRLFRPVNRNTARLGNGLRGQTKKGKESCLIKSCNLDVICQQIDAGL